MISTVERTKSPAGSSVEGLTQPMDSTAHLHRPVLAAQAVDALAARPGGSYVDGTLGGGGHTAAILDRSLPGGRVLAIDADADALEAARPRLAVYGGAVTLVHGSYANLSQHLAEFGWGPVDGVLLDLGLSSIQLQTSGRGFSFRLEEPLDMRFDALAPGPTAADIVNGYPERELTALLRQFGEEPRARAIARAILRQRPFESAAELARAIVSVTGPSRGDTHQATRTFQALRIAVNRELENLEQGLEQAMNCLKPGGRLAVISYHSLEDRIVKNAFRRESKDCLCPPEVLLCQCGHTARVKVINRRIITPTAEETVINPRGRSARMRVAELI